MSDKVRLASVGLGWWGNVLAEAAVAGGAEIAGGFARTPETRDAFTSKQGGRAYSSFEELLADADVDGVLLATPHTAHVDQIVAASEAGKHVFIEKPLTLEVPGAKQAIAAADAAGVVLQVGHNRRRQPANRRLKEMIDSGELGTVTMIETHQSMPNALGFKPGYWRADRAESPLGGMTSLGVHMIDTMTYLLGPIERVFAFSKGILEGPPIDHATSLSVEFASGPVGHLACSFVAPRRVSVQVTGTGGRAFNEEDGARFYWQGGQDPSPAEQPVDVLDTVADELAEFVASIRGEAKPETGGAEGVEVVAVLQAAVASCQSGTAESVADFR
ncbi:MAG: Gfo/Idh/MocA family protein [Acidimicrobiia bacterium]